MKVCEYDSVSCPFCGESEAEYEDKAGNSRGLKELAKVAIHSSMASRPAHHIFCFSCAGEFTIPCED